MSGVKVSNIDKPNSPPYPWEAQHVNDLFDLLKNKIPFGFAKYNDGEMCAIKNSKSGCISRGFQDVTPELGSKLREGLLWKQENWYPGIPCHVCRKDLYDFALSILPSDNIKNIRCAVSFINANTTRTVEAFQKLLPSRNVVLVASEQTIAGIDKLAEFGIKPYKHVSTPHKNSWDAYENVRECYKECNDGDVVLFATGPLGRVLAHEWFKNRPTLTCIEVGSLYDPVTQNKSYMYHASLYQTCIGCNATPLRRLPFNLDGCSKEFYHIMEWWKFVKLYSDDGQGTNPDYDKIRRTFEINVGYYPRHAYYCRWMMAKCVRLLTPDDKEAIKSAYIATYDGVRCEALMEIYSELTVDEKIKYLYPIIYSNLPRGALELNRSYYSWKLAYALYCDLPHDRAEWLECVYKLFNNAHLPSRYHEQVEADWVTTLGKFVPFFKHAVIGPSNTNILRKNVDFNNYLIECRAVKNKSNDTFEFNTGDDCVIVERTDLQSGWGQNLEIYMYRKVKYMSKYCNFIIYDSDGKKVRESNSDALFDVHLSENNTTPINYDLLINFMLMKRAKYMKLDGNGRFNKTGNGSNVPKSLPYIHNKDSSANWTWTF